MAEVPELSFSGCSETPLATRWASLRWKTTGQGFRSFTNRWDAPNTRVGSSPSTQLQRRRVPVSLHFDYIIA